jgi:hypothetical protein
MVDAERETGSPWPGRLPLRSLGSPLNARPSGAAMELEGHTPLAYGSRVGGSPKAALESSRESWRDTPKQYSMSLAQPPQGAAPEWRCSGLAALAFAQFGRAAPSLFSLSCSRLPLAPQRPRRPRPVPNATPSAWAAFRSLAAGRFRSSSILGGPLARFAGLQVPASWHSQSGRDLRLRHPKDAGSSSGSGPRSSVTRS